MSVFLVCGCSNQARHVPYWWQIPGALVSNSLENSIYNSKRAAIKNYVLKNYVDLKNEIKNKNGDHLDEVLRLTKIKDGKTKMVKERLQKDFLIMFENTENISDFLTNLYVSLYLDTISKSTKKINGFSYGEIKNITQNFISNDFRRFKIAVEQQDQSYFREFFKALKIIETNNQNAFMAHIYKEYDRFFIEPVVVGIIIHSG